MDKEVLKEFFLSKGFASIVVILASQFGSQELANTLDMGINFGQNLATSGLLAGAGLAIWSRLGSAKTKVEAKQTAEQVEVERVKKQKARAEAAEAMDRMKRFQEEVERLKPKRQNGKFVKKEK